MRLLRKGFGLGAYVLAEMAKEGIFQTPDFLFAYRMYQQALQTIQPAMGPAKAEILYAHGNMLVTGLAGVTNREHGLALLGQAARMGHLHSGYRLWRIHSHGEGGGKKDPKAANFWYR